MDPVRSSYGREDFDQLLYAFASQIVAVLKDSFLLILSCHYISALLLKSIFIFTFLQC